MCSLLIGILHTNCSSDDNNGINCSLFDPVFPELYIRLVDDAGTNLIENGTIDPKNITVEGDFPNPDFRYTPPNEYAEPNADIRKYDNTLALFIANKLNFEYTINLDDSTSITLNFETRYVELPCEIAYFVPTKLTYNNQNLDSENVDTDKLIFLAEIKI